MSKTTITAAGFCWPECLTAHSTPAPSVETSAPSTGDPGAEWWISSLEGFRVRTYRTPDDGRASGESGADCGPSSPDWLAKFDPDTCSLKMSQRCLFEEWSESSVTLPPSGTMRSGYVYRRQPWAPRTSASASSCWPTPNERDHKGAPGKGCQERGGHQSSLPASVALWPTAGANDWKGTAAPGQRRGQLDEAAEQLLCTPKTITGGPEKRKTKEARGSGGIDLQTQVLSLSSHPVPPSENSGASSSPSVPKSSRRLNPLFVTWLMGFPIGWLSSKPLEMQSYLLKVRRHLRSCLSG